MCLRLISTTASRVLTLLARTVAVTIGKAEQAIGQGRSAPIGKAEEAIGLIFVEGRSQWISELKASARDRSSWGAVVEPWSRTTAWGPGVESNF